MGGGSFSIFKELKQKEMNLPTTPANLVEKLSVELLKDDKMMNFLMSVNLYNFELEVRDMCSEIFNGIMSVVLPQACRQVCQGIRDEYDGAGLKKLEERPLAIELHTGHRVVVPSLYAKSLCEQVPTSRHLLARHWLLLPTAVPFD